MAVEIGKATALAATGSYVEMEEQNHRLESERNIPDPTVKGKVHRLLWHGGSVYYAWFSAASNQVGYQNQRASNALVL